MNGKIKDLKVEVLAEPCIIKPQPQSTSNKICKLLCPSTFTGSKTISLRTVLNKKFDHTSPKNQRNNKSMLKEFNTRTNHFNSVNNSLMTASLFLNCTESKTDRPTKVKVTSNMRKYSVYNSKDKTLIQRISLDYKSKSKMKIDVNHSDKLKNKSMNIINNYALNYVKLRKLSDDGKPVFSERNNCTNGSFMKLSTNENSSEVQVNNAQSATVILDNLDHNHINEYSHLQFTESHLESVKPRKKADSDNKLRKESVPREKKSIHKNDGNANILNYR